MIKVFGRSPDPLLDLFAKLADHISEVDINKLDGHFSEGYTSRIEKIVEHSCHDCGLPIQTHP